MYLDDPREEMIDIANHTVWEADNRKETRYQWGAAIWDLCNMDPKDYGETIFVTRTAGEELIKNTLHTVVEGNKMTIDFPYSPISDIYIVAKDSDGNKEVIILSAGSISPFMYEITAITGSKISSLCIGPSEDEARTPTFSDDKYEYRITKEIVVDALGQYAVIKHSLFEAGLTPSIIKANMNEAFISDLATSFVYSISPIGIEGLNDMSEEEYENVKKENAVDFIFLTTTSIKKIYMAGEYDQTSSWDCDYQTMIIDGTRYKISHFKDSMVNIYDPAYQSPETYHITYKITLNKN